jgi:CheY-like chemotaxis protein
MDGGSWMVDGQSAVRSALPNTRKTAILSPMAPGPEYPFAVPRVLLVEESLPFRRVIREALTAFRNCEVDDTSSAEHAFEMALQKEYGLFIFSLPLPGISGDLLDRLIARAYPLAHRGSHTAPPVIYLMRPQDLQTFQNIQRDARVKGSLEMPPRLDALIAMTEKLLPARSHVPRD